MAVIKPLFLMFLLAVPPLSGQARPDPLTTFNEAFRASYLRAKAARLAQSGPVLLVDGDHLAFYRDGRKLSVGLIRPPLYHRLKAVAHVPLALQVLSTLPPASAAELAGLRDLARSARNGLPDWCPRAALGRQERILDASLRLLDELLAGGPRPEATAAFCAEQGPLLLANAEDAAALELDELHRQVGALRRRMPGSDWQALRVVIIGAHMAREGEVAWQYFSRLLGQPREGERIVYAEGLWAPSDALDLLATHLLDGAAGAAFFHDPMRMHRDVLADGAGRWLDAHLPSR